MACGAGNLRWINVTAAQRSGASEWRLYKIGNVLTGYRAALHECEGTDPA
jgi:anaerobic glycerol-3-phosphate dehydrogenase